MTNTLLVTGGAGFIGSNFIEMLVADRPDWRIINLDALTYAGNLENLTQVENHPGYQFVKGDVAIREDVARAFDACGSEGQVSVVHFAAESHVDRSIAGGLPFVMANVVAIINCLYHIESFFLKGFYVFYTTCDWNIIINQKSFTFFIYMIWMLMCNDAMCNFF